MPKNRPAASKSKKPNPQRPASTPRQAPPAPESDTTLLRTLRFVFLAIAIGATAVLTAKHFHLFTPPGCGPGGGCDKAAQSIYGKIADISWPRRAGWPVSSIGLAYFIAMTVALAATKGMVTPLYRHMARLGGVGSAFYIFILIANRKEYFCEYCLVSHVANFAFLATVELATRTTPRSLRSFGVAAAAFALTTAALAGGELVSRGKTQATLDESIAEMVAETQRRQAAQQAQPATPGTDTPAQTAATTTTTPPPQPVAPPPAPVPGDPAAAQARAARLGLPNNIPDTVTPKGFMGRYQIGPPDAAIRIVAFMGYQCPDCKRLEKQIVDLIKQRPDVSLSVRHFPFNKDCNPNFQTTHHPNACWAARAAETAGLLRGNRGFWEMHFWLFERNGAFTDAELVAGLRELGYDPAEFQRLMMTDITLKPIQEDVQEAMSLGLFFTPMIFINGVELRGWNAQDSVRTAVTALSRTNPQPADATSDMPPRALEKYISDWSSGFRRGPAQLARPSFDFATGPADAPISIIVFGDYEEVNTRKADAIIRKRMAERGDIRYDFRHYPVNDLCNPLARNETHKKACDAARAVEAAARLGDTAAFWEVHAWLMDNPIENLTDDTLKAKIEQMGLDWQAFNEERGGPDVRDAMLRDAKQMAEIFAARSIPHIVVNGRSIPRWTMPDGRSILEEIMELAATTER